MGKQIRIEITDDLEHNLCHRLRFDGLKNAYSFAAQDEVFHKDFVKHYDYDKTLPPFWSAGISEARCFTLPYAIYLVCYDLCQWHDDLQKDGDVFVFEWEGKTYSIEVGTWPTCEAAVLNEMAFRNQNNITPEQARG